MKDQTLAIHAGFKSDPTTKATAVPVYQTVAYEFDNAQHGADMIRLCIGIEDLEDIIADLEQALTCA
jgi:O-acetylhomoserine (thiol)-lyase